MTVHATQVSCRLMNSSLNIPCRTNHLSVGFSCVPPSSKLAAFICMNAYAETPDSYIKHIMRQFGSQHKASQLALTRYLRFWQHQSPKQPCQDSFILAKCHLLMLEFMNSKINIQQDSKCSSIIIRITIKLRMWRRWLLSFRSEGWVSSTRQYAIFLYAFSFFYTLSGVMLGWRPTRPYQFFYSPTGGGGWQVWCNWHGGGWVSVNEWQLVLSLPQL